MNNNRGCLEKHIFFIKQNTYKIFGKGRGVFFHFDSKRPVWKYYNSVSKGPSLVLLQRIWMKLHFLSVQFSADQIGNQIGSNFGQGIWRDILQIISKIDSFVHVFIKFYFVGQIYQYQFPFVRFAVSYFQHGRVSLRFSASVIKGVYNEPRSSLVRIDFSI